MLKILIKNRLRSVFGAAAGRGKGGAVKKADAGRIALVTVLYVILVGSFLLLSTTVAVSLGYVLIPIGASWLYFAIFMIATLSLIFIFSIFETKSELFECKDNDLLLSMPIKPRDIVLSRVSVVLVYNYLEMLIIMLPCIIIYGIISADAVGIIGAFLVSLLIPLLATALASAVGYAVACIAKKIKKNSLVTVLISLIFLFIYFVGYEMLFSGMDTFLADIAEQGSLSAADMPLLYNIGAAALLKPLNILALAALSVASAAIAYAIISKSYIRLVTDNGEESRAVYKSKEYKARTPLMTLVSKELRYFFSSATYMLNTGLGLVFEVILGVLALSSRSMISEISVELFGTSDGIAPLMICAIVLISSLNMMSAPALSLEGKRLWIPKTMPLEGREVLLSKALPQIIVSTPPTLICSVLLAIASSAPAELWLFFILTPFVANAASAFFGVVINVAFPKFDYENEAQPIKQSLATFIVMMAQMLLGMGAIVLSFITSFLMPPILVALITFALYAALAVAFYLTVTGPSARRYSKFEV